jgi:hypothetical protein
VRNVFDAADMLRGEVVGGLALEISSFVASCEMARADRLVPFNYISGCSVARQDGKAQLEGHRATVRGLEFEPIFRLDNSLEGLD